MRAKWVISSPLCICMISSSNGTKCWRWMRYIQNTYMITHECTTLLDTALHIHSRFTNKRCLTLSCYLYINKEKQRRREKKNRHTVSLSHFTLFQPSGRTAVSLHSHRWPPHCHVAVQWPIWTHCYLQHGLVFQCWWRQMSVNNVFSDLQVKGRLVKAPGFKLGTYTV